MNKPTKISLLLLIVLLSSIILYVTIYKTDELANSRSTNAQDAALNDAALFQPAEVCDETSTIAEHQDSGAQYTFETNCLPEGWVSLENEPEIKPDGTYDDSDENEISPIAPDNPADIPSSTPGTDTAAYEAALEQARNFVPKGACTTVMTPAHHTATGATYTFSSGCLPEGWIRISGSSSTI